MYMNESLWFGFSLFTHNLTEDSLNHLTLNIGYGFSSSLKCFCTCSSRRGLMFTYGHNDGRPLKITILSQCWESVTPRLLNCGLFEELVKSLAWPPAGSRQPTECSDPPVTLPRLHTCRPHICVTHEWDCCWTLSRSKCFLNSFLPRIHCAVCVCVFCRRHDCEREWRHGGRLSTQRDCSAHPGLRQHNQVRPHCVFSEKLWNAASQVIDTEYLVKFLVL